ncbi:FtsK/SpoIIIE domain-containing protein [Mycolicibacterium porcinum]|uniref:FtsK/SpoIIIE domain-containing protein n=1 Tax=Mycolicibacterium porcinum TaxID=39693 RepID=A0ABV3VR74_9MYCO
MVSIDSDDLVSATELTRNTAALVKLASEGRRLIIINKNAPTAALIGMEDLRRLDALRDNNEQGTGAVVAQPHPSSDDFHQALLACAFPVDESESTPASLRIPLGINACGEPVRLDMASPAAGGTGPHGAIIGMTGQGKTNMAKVITTALTALYRPDQVNVILATDDLDSQWQSLADKPHVKHVFDDLSGQPEQQLRSLLDQEAHRRQHLRDSDDPENPSGHHLPHLVVIVDEAGRYPELAKHLINELGRSGGTLGIHLLLLFQRPPRSDLGAFGYRIILRLRDFGDSRYMIGSSAAARLSVGSAILSRGDDPSDHTDFAAFLASPQFE